MFIRNIALCVIIFCLASFFVGLPFAEAHLGTPAEEHELDEAEVDRDNAYDEEV